MNRTGRGFGERFTKWIENPRIPGVRKTVTSSADTVDTAHVGLVLDRPRSQKGHPVLTTHAGPVGRNEIEVGVRGRIPEEVGEAQVVTDKWGDADTLDHDRFDRRAAVVVVGFAGKRERLGLGITVIFAVWPGEQEAVGRSIVATRGSD